MVPSRTFARVLDFDVVCPQCGTIDCVRSRSRLPGWKARLRFNPITARWQCRACRRIYAVGLAVWPVRRTGNVPRDFGQPVDTVPNEFQRADLHELYGIVRAESRGWRDPVNLICTCPAFEGKHAPDCPLAGRSADAD